MEEAAAQGIHQIYMEVGIQSQNKYWKTTVCGVVGSIKSRSFVEVGPAFESLCTPLFARHMMLMTIMIPFCCLSKTGTPVLLYHSPISFYLYSDGCKRKTGTLRRPWEMSRGAGSPVIPILAYARGLCSMEHPKNVFSLNTVNNRSNKRNNEVWICLETGAHVES